LRAEPVADKVVLLPVVPGGDVRRPVADMLRRVVHDVGVHRVVPVKEPEPGEKATLIFPLMVRLALLREAVKEARPVAAHDTRVATRASRSLPPSAHTRYRAAGSWWNP